MSRIAESELMLSKDGSIYHLRLRPENLGRTVITVGDPERVPEISRYFDSIEFQMAHREFVTHTGFIGKKRLTVVSTGIGTDNIDIVLNELDALVNINLETRMIKPKHTSLQIIRLGTCGSLQQDIEVDSQVVSDMGLGLDGLLHFYLHENTVEEKELLNFFVQQALISSPASMPYLASGSQKLLKGFCNGYHHGITLTCPGFYAPQGRSLRATLAYPQMLNVLTSFRYGPWRILNFEMETAGLYGLGTVLGHDCLSISTVVANRISKEFSRDIPTTVDRMIKQALEIIMGL